MMAAARMIWSGKGDAEGQVTFSKDNGELVGRGYVRARVRDGLRRWDSSFGAEVRRATLAETVDCDEWLSRRGGQTIGSLVRDAESHLIHAATRPAPQDG